MGCWEIWESSHLMLLTDGDGIFFDATDNQSCSDFSSALPCCPENKVMGSNPARCWTFFLFSFCLLNSQGAQELTGGKVASSGLSLSKQGQVVVIRQTIFSLLQATSWRVKETGFKHSPMKQPYLLLALALPAAVSNVPLKTGLSQRYHT